MLYNYLEANNRVPWEDLRYLFGEIMYGGHITDDWDRRLCATYLEEYLQPELVSVRVRLRLSLGWGRAGRDGGQRRPDRQPLTGLFLLARWTVT